MENRRIIKLATFIKGGALIGALFITSTAVLAYDPNNAHPALTDEIVNLYNLNVPSNKLSAEDKKWLIKGSTDEDSGERSLFHFYDPVYNRGIVFLSSKEWALKNHAQADFYNRQLTGLVSVTNTESNADFSYDRALQDYARGDRKRAMIAFGHVLHLLEDTGVPDHTRNDPHPPYFDEAFNQASPYEQEMTKWNPQNFNIAQKLLKSGEKPVILNSMRSYFDRVANYSNNNFFSKDTINNETYYDPDTKQLEIIPVNGRSRLFIINKDKNNQDFPIALVGAGEDKELNNAFLLTSPKIGSYILDSYWNRLSPEIVLNGAGALKLFLEDAERAKVEYAKKLQEKPSLWAQLLRIFGIGDTSDNVSADLGDVDNNDNPQGLVTQTSKIGDTKTLPLVSPIMSPSPLVSPIVSVSPTPTPSKTLTPLSAQKLSTAKNSGKIVINEIAWAGTSASAADEWIELYNTENYPIDISSWQLVSSDNSPDIIFPEGTTIQANAYFLIERSDDDTVSDKMADLTTSFGQGGLNNTGEMIRLFDSEGTVVDVVGGAGETWYSGDSSSKNSMERIDPIKAGNNLSNWKNFTGTPVSKDAKGNLINGTPRAKNSTVIQVVVPTGSGGSGGGSSGGSSIPTPTPQATPTPTTPSPSPTPTPSPTPEQDGDNDGDTANFGDVVINEIAWMGTATSSFDEWIELYNTTEQPINLNGWMLKSLTGDSPDPQIVLSGTIGAFGYFLLERTDDTSISDISADQIYTGALSDTGEYLELRDIANEVIDSVDGSAEWPAGDNTTKSSMERINPAQPGNNSTNWNTNDGVTKNGLDAGENPINGTPKAENSVYNTSPVLSELSAVTDLTANVTGWNFILNWSAPGIGDFAVASLSYDIRYSTKSFEIADTWDEALKLASANTPAVEVTGALQNASFNIAYSYDQKWYFALKTKFSTCDVENCDPSDISDISNIADATTLSAIDDSAWVMIGKDNLHTSFVADITGPGSTATISWEFDAGAMNTVSQPVVSANGNIYFGATNGSSGQLIKIDKNGVKQWEYATNVSIGTPAVLSDEAVYFGRIGAGGVLAVTALNPDGSKRWDYDSASTVKNITVSSKGEPHFTYQGGAQDKLAVLNPDGSVKTMISGTGLNNFSPIVLKNGNIITATRISGHPFFTAYSSAGEEIWNKVFSEGYDYLPSNPSFDVLTGTMYAAVDHYIVEISEAGELAKTTIAPLGISTTMVAISPDTLYVGFDYSYINPASGSKLFAINKSDLTTKWATPFSADSRINQQVVIDQNGNSYFSTQNGTLYSVDKDGTENWHIGTGISSTISPVLTDNGIIWGYGNKIVGILP